MNELTQLEARLETVRNRLSVFEVDSKTHEFMSLAAERRKLASEIARFKWGSLTEGEKLEVRKEDFLLTEKYFNKYGEDVKEKYLFKKRYIEFVDKVASVNNPRNPVLSILYELLNSSIYMDSYLKFCIDIVMKELSNERNSKVQDLLDVYAAILNTNGLESNHMID